MTACGASIAGHMNKRRLGWRPQSHSLESSAVEVHTGDGSLQLKSRPAVVAAQELSHVRLVHVRHDVVAERADQVVVGLNFFLKRSRRLRVKHRGDESVGAE